MLEKMMDDIHCDNCNRIAYTRWQFTGEYTLLKGECFLHPERTNVKNDNDQIVKVISLSCKS